MKIELGLAPLCALFALWPIEKARAEKPPVDIQIVEEEGDDFFTADPRAKDGGKKKDDAKKDPAKPAEGAPSVDDDSVPTIEDIERARSTPGTAVERDATEAFDELEAIERAKGKNAPTGGADRRPARDRPVAAPKGDGDRSAGSRAGDTGAIERPTSTKPTTGSEITYSVGSWKSWWERPVGLAPGDLVLTYSLGGYGGGAHHGLTLEGIFNEWGGLALTVQVGAQSRFGMHHDGERLDARNLDFFLGGRSAGPNLDESTPLERAILHMETLAMNIHTGNGRGFELVPSVGVSHFGYDVKLATGEILRGGAGYFRLGGQLAYVHHRFIIGLDVGWYPVELFRYTLEQRGPRGHLDLVDQGTSDNDSRRVTAALFMGASF